MLKINDAVRELVLNDEVAMSAIADNYMNYSKYAEKIKRNIEKLTFKKVSAQSIVVSLTRLSKKMNTTNSIIKRVDLEAVTIKSSLVEIVYSSSTENHKNLNSFYTNLKLSNNDFYTSTTTPQEITVICSHNIAPKLMDKIKEKPVAKVDGLAAILLSIDPKYYPKPNITYSLIRRIALKQIPLAETITTRSNIIFVFSDRHLKVMVGIFT